MCCDGHRSSIYSVCMRRWWPASVDPDAMRTAPVTTLRSPAAPTTDKSAAEWRQLKSKFLRKALGWFTRISNTIDQFYWLKRKKSCGYLTNDKFYSCKKNQCGYVKGSCVGCDPGAYALFACRLNHVSNIMTVPMSLTRSSAFGY